MKTEKLHGAVQVAWHQDGDLARIYFDDFHIIDPVLYYYRKPRKVEFLNCSDIATGNIITVDVTSEFKDDIVEIIIDEAVAILSGDIENFNQVQRNKNNANINT